MTSAAARVLDALGTVPHRIVACSGGVDSLLLADLAHTAAPESTVVAHAVTPAVPRAATARVERAAETLGWRLRLVSTAEFDDERYLANPVDRCYFCKTSLYDELDRVAGGLADLPASDWTLLSGANLDDLGDYRPGLVAASEHRVRHPFVEGRFGKPEIRELARARGRDWHDLPAAPCLASRLYTGTRVTPGLLRAVEDGEALATRLTGSAVLRCRIRDERVRVEVPEEHRAAVTPAVLDLVLAAMRRSAPALTGIELDPEPYAPGRAFIGAPSTAQTEQTAPPG